MAAQANGYFPFRGLSAWFSCSVNPSVVKLWEHHGGLLEGQSDAMYLFSDDPFTKDTTRLYDWQKDIVVAQTSWIKEVLHKRCPVKDVVLGKHLLTPHFMIGLNLKVKGDHLSRSPETNGDMSESTQSSALTSGGRSAANKGTVHSTLAPEAAVKTVGKHGDVASVTTSGARGEQSGRGKSPPTSSSMQTCYNAVWNKLEQDCTDNPPEGILHVKHVSDTNAKKLLLLDFDVSLPAFKVYKQVNY